MSPPTDGPVTLQTRLEEAERPTPRSGPARHDDAAGSEDVVDRLLGLEESGQLHRDAGWGRLFHLGGVSFRENKPEDSLHISVHGRLQAHVDHVSPLRTEDEHSPDHSLHRTLAHNAAGMVHDLVRLVRGRQGDHRCELNCEWVWDQSESEPNERDLLDPTASLWSVQLEVRGAGALDDQRLRAAVKAVLGGQGMERDPVDTVDCPDDSSLDAARGRLHAEVVWPGECPPLRACLARRPNGDVLMLSLNHAATDGYGALRVLDCIAQAYANGTQPDSPLDFLSTRTVPVRPRIRSGVSGGSDLQDLCRRVSQRARTPHSPRNRRLHGRAGLRLPSGQALT